MKSASASSSSRPTQADAQLGRPRRGHVGVVGDHLHAERGQPLGDQHADPAEAEDPGHLAVELDAGELDRFHSPALSEAIACGTLRATASSSPTACSAALTMFELGAFTTMTPALVAASTSTLSRPDPGPGHHPQVRRVRQRLGVDPGRAADDHRVHAGQRGQQRGPVGAVHVADLEVGFELRDRGG